MDEGSGAPQAQHVMSDRPRALWALLAAVLLVASVAAGVAAFYFYRLSTSLRAQNALLTQQGAQQSQRIAQLTCTGTWTNGTCQQAALTLLAPKGGETICMNGAYDIAWSAPRDMEFVTIYLESFSPQQTFYPIAQNIWANPKNEEEGSPYHWTVSDTVSANVQSVNGLIPPIAPSDKYKIFISGTYNGNNVKAESDFVTLKDCAQT